MYIAGSNDDIQGGICYGGIAHAPRPRLQPATWFNGIDKYVQTPITIAQNGHATLTAWTYLQESPPLNKYFNSFYYFRVNQTLRVIPDTATGYSNPPIKQIIHMGMSQNGDSSTVKIYINGVFVASPSASNIITATQLFWGCASNTQSRWHGVVYECRYYNRQIADNEMLAIYQDNAPPTPTAYWKGDGNTNDAWRDQVGEAHCTVYGSPERCLIREGDGKVILNNIIQNP